MNSRAKELPVPKAAPWAIVDNKDGFCCCSVGAGAGLGTTLLDLKPLGFTIYMIYTYDAY